MNLAFQTGTSLPRWQKSLDISLLKKSEKLKPSDLRTIGQLEADFNQGATVHFSQRMMNRALTYNQIPESQYAKKDLKQLKPLSLKYYFSNILDITKFLVLLSQKI